MDGMQDRQDRGVATQLGEEVLAAQRQGLIGLVQGLTRLGPADGWAGLQEVVEALPLAVSVDLALVSVQEERRGGHFSVCAAAGLSARELTRLAFSPLTSDQARAAADRTSSGPLSHELGLLWGSGRWLENDGAAGMLVTGCRTGRRPGAAEEVLLDLVADEISTFLPVFDRESRALRRRAAQLARSRGSTTGRASPLGNLRRREVQILELYGDGLGTSEIAQLLVISPHTVRTHVRNALRSLGVGSRQEAVTRLRQRQLEALGPGSALPAVHG